MIAVTAWLIAAAGFVAFVYVYPLVFPLVVASHPMNFQSRVAEMVSAGDVDRAVKIARKATEYSPHDPMAYTVHGQTLLLRGDEARGVEELEHAVHMQRLSSGGDTRRPFYYAPARLALGRHHLERGELAEAIIDFELARAYADPADPSFASFRDALFAAYAEHGLWNRALEFGELSSGQLKGREIAALLDIAQTAVEHGNWPLARMTATELRERGEITESHYVLGRAGLGEHKPTDSIAHLEQAAAEGHADAGYFLGVALEEDNRYAEAIETYVDVPNESPYQAFSYGRALDLLEKLSPDERLRVERLEGELLERLKVIIEEMRARRRPATFNKYSKLEPIAVDMAEEFGERVTVVTLWEAGPTPIVDWAQISTTDTGTEGVLQLTLGDQIALTLQSAENRLNWGSIDDPLVNELPGWIDTARDWFELRSEYAARIERDATRGPFLVIPKMTWFYSVPVQVRRGANYVLAGRINTPTGKGSVGWQALDDTERVIASGEILDGAEPEKWTGGTGYIQPLPHWESIRVQLNVAPHAGNVGFDDLLLIEVAEPLQPQ